jgi:glycosyltransferase involved in cell wall biosynthesis
MTRINNNSNKPLVSIITVVLNNKKFLEKSILSVLNQNYKNIELIIIDGGSTDGTLDIIKKYKSKINFLISEKDNGLYDAMNKGIKNSKGSIIGILNSDDIYYSNAISTAVKYFINNRNIDFLFGGVIKHKLLHGYKPWKIYWSFGFYSAHSIGFFITRKAQMNVGYYNTKYKYSSDYDLFYRMILKKNMTGMATKKSEVFGKFRRGGISSKITFFEYLMETIKIRIDNGQNKLIVFIIFLAKVVKKIISR